MAKNSRLRPQTAPLAALIVLASSNLKCHEMFGGKTLYQIGEEFDLSDEDVTFGFGTNPKTNEEIKSLMIKVKGVKYQVPFSRGAKADELVNLDECGNWMFRSGHLRKKDEAGEPVGDDENGKPVLDMMAPYMSFGRPTGIIVEREEAAFSPVGESEKAAETVV